MCTTGHVPVLETEVISYLCKGLPTNAVILDGTLGAGGHTKRIIEQIAPQNGRVIALDVDRITLESTKKRLEKYKQHITFVQANFKESKQILRQCGVEKVHGVLLDLGISSMQVDNAERGFSFSKSGPLDMRMGESIEKTAKDIVNKYSEDALYTIFRDYGEERWSRRIARRIVDTRKKILFTHTQQLVDIVLGSIPSRFRRHQRIHPATRVFQALRIETNDELETLKSIISDLPDLLHVDGRAVIISFHSLEDRIVKHMFREYKRQGIMEVLTKKPLVPTRDEILSNRRARSAKLRVIKRINPV